jgi:hypothetical protein
MIANGRPEITMEEAMWWINRQISIY